MHRHTHTHKDTYTDTPQHTYSHTTHTHTQTNRQERESARSNSNANYTKVSLAFLAPSLYLLPTVPSSCWFGHSYPHHHCFPFLQRASPLTTQSLWHCILGHISLNGCSPHPWGHRQSMPNHFLQGCFPLSSLRQSSMQNILLSSHKGSPSLSDTSACFCFMSLHSLSSGEDTSIV